MYLEVKGSTKGTKQFLGGNVIVWFIIKIGGYYTVVSKTKMLRRNENAALPVTLVTSRAFRKR